MMSTSCPPGRTFGDDVCICGGVQRNQRENGPVSACNLATAPSGWRTGNVGAVVRRFYLVLSTGRVLARLVLSSFSAGLYPKNRRWRAGAHVSQWSEQPRKVFVYPWLAATDHCETTRGGFSQWFQFPHRPPGGVPGADYSTFGASRTARFEAERQALALMDHPNIARILDAGTTGVGVPALAGPSAAASQDRLKPGLQPEGRPYFVMDSVRENGFLPW